MWTESAQSAAVVSRAALQSRGVSVTRQTPVVNDLFDAGWHAELRGTNGSRAVPIERVDHALRGIGVEPGAWTIELRYDPLGVKLALFAAGRRHVTRWRHHIRICAIRSSGVRRNEHQYGLPSSPSS